MKKFSELSEVVVFSDIRKGNKVGLDKFLNKNKYSFLATRQKENRIFKPFGKIGNAEVYTWSNSKETAYVVFESEKSTIYLETIPYGPFSEQISGVAATKNITKVKDLYAFIVKNGKDLVSDIMQSQGGHAIWKSLSKERGVTVFGWDGSKMYNLGSKLDDYTDLETHTVPGEEFDSEDTAILTRKMVLVATRKK